MEKDRFDSNSDNGNNPDKSPDWEKMVGQAYAFKGQTTTNGYHDSAQEKKGVESIGTNTYLSVVIPAYNEARRLPTTLDKVLKWLDSQPYHSEVVVVDDGSKDSTAAIVQRLMQSRQTANEDDSQRSRLRLIENPHRGKAFAVRTGMLQGCGDFILFSDADLATPVNEASKLLFWLDQGFDVAIGSREGVGARRYGEPYYRHVMGRAFNLLVRLITGSPFQDTQCGFKAFTRHSAHDLFHRVKLYNDGDEGANKVQGAMVTGFDVEVLFLALKKGYRVKEVPVEWYHVPGSKVNPVKDSLRNLGDVLTVRWNDLKGKYR